jgi:hypothetical protein
MYLNQIELLEPFSHLGSTLKMAPIQSHSYEESVLRLARFKRDTKSPLGSRHTYLATHYTTRPHLLFPQHYNTTQSATMYRHRPSSW